MTDPAAASPAASSPAPALAAGAARARSSTGLSRRLALATLGRMTRGEMHLELPGGSVVRLGAPPGGSWHDGTRAPAALAIPAVAAVRVRREAFFRKCVLSGDIGFAESYIDGDWDTPDLTAVIAWFILNVEDTPTLSGSGARALGVNLLRAFNRLGHRLRDNSRRLSVRNIREHYDLSNEFFALWLDPSMMYSSALWDGPGATLEEAQERKNEALCRKLALSPADHVLEIGTGWGGWSLHAARRHGCRVTTVTLSARQHELALRRVREAGLERLVEVRLQDYRDIPASERYDKLVSIEMLEAVGHAHLGDWCRVAGRALRREGVMALQFITCPDSRSDAMRRGVDFIQKHVFPGSQLLSLNRLNTLLARTGDFVLHGVEDLGQDYARTLREWRAAFDRRSAEVLGLGFDERFLRKWRYYLSYCEAAFALRNISVVQTVHVRPNAIALPAHR